MRPAHLLWGYFNRVYNPLYDRTTGHLPRYVEALRLLAEDLQLKPGLRILCVGLGTGNELTHIRTAGTALQIVGVDFSRPALLRARQKAAAGDATTRLALMDAHHLALRDNSFDRVLCYHVTDFLSIPDAAASEMVRVLRPGGRLVASFPAKRDGLGLGISLMSGNTAPDADKETRATTLRTVATGLAAGLAYLPLLLRPNATTYSRDQLDALFNRLGITERDIRDDPAYRDFIVCGMKMEGASGET